MKSIKEARKQLQKRFVDLDVEATTSDSCRIFSKGGNPFEDYNVTISSHELKFRKGYEIHDDLILFANNFRKDYFNVL